MNYIFYNNYNFLDMISVDEEIVILSWLKKSISLQIKENNNLYLLF